MKSIGTLLGAMAGAWLFQGGALFDSISVYDNIAYPIREHLDLAERELPPDSAQYLFEHLAAVGGKACDPPVQISITTGTSLRSIDVEALR